MRYSLQRSIVTSTSLLKLIQIVFIGLEILNLDGVGLDALCENGRVSVHELLQTRIKLFFLFILFE